MPQLYVLPQNVTGLPTTFDYHPFRFIDFKEQAHIHKQAAQRLAVWAQERQRRFYMDFGFMRASTSDYSQRDKAKDQVVFSYNDFSSYLLIVDEASRYVWLFLTASKSPPLTSSRSFSINTVMRMVGVFGRIKAANWLGARPSRICFCGIFTILLNQLVPTAPPKMVQLKYTMTNLAFPPAPYSTAPVSLLNCCPRPSSILSTFTIGWSIAKPKSLHSNVTLA